MKIFESASKIVFIIIALGVTFFTYMRIIEAKDYMMLAAMVFTFYFSNKGDAATTASVKTETTAVPPFLGK